MEHASSSFRHRSTLRWCARKRRSLQLNTRQKHAKTYTKSQDTLPKSCRCFPTESRLEDEKPKPVHTVILRSSSTLISSGPGGPEASGLELNEAQPESLSRTPAVYFRDTEKDSQCIRSEISYELWKVSKKLKTYTICVSNPPRSVPTQKPTDHVKKNHCTSHHQVFFSS